jgi:DNA-binding MarR family transcriptional regulator
MGPTTNLSYLLQHLSEVLAKQHDHVLQKQLEIGFSQYKILMVLEWNPRIQQRTIATALGQTEASISRQIKLLKNKGLLATRLDPTNRRRHITAPTTLGMQVTEAATALMRRSFGPEFDRLGEEQLARLISTLQQLHQIVCRPGRLGVCNHQLGI